MNTFISPLIAQRFMALARQHGYAVDTGRVDNAGLVGRWIGINRKIRCAIDVACRKTHSVAQFWIDRVGGDPSAQHSALYTEGRA